MAQTFLIHFRPGRLDGVSESVEEYLERAARAAVRQVEDLVEEEPTQQLLPEMDAA